MNSPSSNKCLISWQEFEERYCVSKWLELSISFFDCFLLHFLWFCFTTIAVLACCLRLDFHGAPYVAIIFSFLSLFAHLIHETSSVLREYPYWRSVEFRATSRQTVSEPLLASCVVFFLTTFFSSYSSASLYLLLYTFVFDCVVAARVSSYVETNVRTFLEKLSSPVDSAIAWSEQQKKYDSFGAEKEVVFNDLFNSNPLEVENFDDFTLSTQRRFLTKDGTIQISGRVRVEIESELENSVAWISFCPPFDQTPKFEYEQIGDDDVMVNVAFVQPYGVRLEAKRRPRIDATERMALTIEYFAASKYE